MFLIYLARQEMANGTNGRIFWALLCLLLAIYYYLWLLSHA